MDWAPFLTPPVDLEKGAYLTWAREHRVLIIGDSLVAFHDGSEQDTTATRRCMDQLRRPANFGATVVPIHPSSCRRAGLQEQTQKRALEATSDGDLQLLHDWIARRAPFSESSPEQQAALERYRAAYEAAGRSIVSRVTTRAGTPRSRAGRFRLDKN